MLRYKEKEDLEARLSALDEVIHTWRRQVKDVTPSLRQKFREHLLISLIYHDAALEGEVLTYNEIKAALAPALDEDSSPIPQVAGQAPIRHYYDACMRMESLRGMDRRGIDFDTLREIYAILAPEEKERGFPYRQENPLHRLYYHDITQPEHIEAQSNAFAEWLDNARSWQQHPIEYVAEFHFRLMAIFPWTKQTGRCARIASNLLLRQAAFPLSVLHSIDRQAYYEALRTSPSSLALLYIEANETAALSELRVYEEAGELSTLRAS